jgi:hypothetical protein
MLFIEQNILYRYDSLQTKDLFNKDYKQEIGKFLCEAPAINFLRGFCNIFDFKYDISGIRKSDDFISCDRK